VRTLKHRFARLGTIGAVSAVATAAVSAATLGTAITGSAAPVPRATVSQMFAYGDPTGYGEDTLTATSSLPATITQGLDFTGPASNGRRWRVTTLEPAYAPTTGSWLNRIGTQFPALRSVTLDGTDHASHDEQNSMIRRSLAWRHRHAHDERLRELVARAHVA
jgi:hypothetical protein